MTASAETDRVARLEERVAELERLVVRLLDPPEIPPELTPAFAREQAEEAAR